MECFSSVLGGIYGPETFTCHQSLVASAQCVPLPLTSVSSVSSVSIDLDPGQMAISEKPASQVLTTQHPSNGMGRHI